MPAAAQSLDHVAAGDTVTVERILFDGLRALCRDQGVMEGTRLSCRVAGADAVILETEKGGAVPCERRLARFIAVTRAGG